MTRDLLEDAHETALFGALQSSRDKAESAIQAEDFENAMIALGTLRAPIDAFFDHVLVNDENTSIRANRLALLNEISGTIGAVADFSRISG